MAILQHLALLRGHRSFHSRTTYASPQCSRSPTGRDDIDFVYEQEAEATCDFDWDYNNRSLTDSYQSDGGVRLSALYGPQDSFVYADGGRDSPILSSDDNRQSRVLSIGSTAADQMDTQKSAGSTRGSAVGHRGFAAARISRGDFSTKVAQLANLTALAPSPPEDAPFFPGGE